uniref:Non-structural n=1 Tax=Latid herpesvirus 1 TaxID=3096545 RepID=A0AB33V6I8_9VIRU
MRAQSMATLNQGWKSRRKSPPVSSVSMCRPDPKKNSVSSRTRSPARKTSGSSPWTRHSGSEMEHHSAGSKTRVSIPGRKRRTAPPGAAAAVVSGRQRMVSIRQHAPPGPPSLKRIRLGFDGDVFMVESKLKRESITEFRRLANIQLTNPKKTRHPVPATCEECENTPTVTLGCECKEGGAPKCAPCAARLLETHPCFRARACHGCGRHSFERISKIFCCQIFMCDDCLSMGWYMDYARGAGCPSCGFKSGTGHRALNYVENLVCVKKKAANLLRTVKHISGDLLEELRRCRVSGDELFQLFGKETNLMAAPETVPGHLLAPKMHTLDELRAVCSDAGRPRCSSATCAGRRVAGWVPGCEVPVLYLGSPLCVFCTVEKQELTISSMTICGSHWEREPVTAPFYMSVWFDPTTVGVEPVDVSQITTFAIDFGGKLGGYHPEKFYRVRDLIENARWDAGSLCLDGLAPRERAAGVAGPGPEIPKNPKSRTRGPTKPEKKRRSASSPMPVPSQASRYPKK